MSGLLDLLTGSSGAGWQNQDPTMNNGNPPANPGAGFLSDPSMIQKLGLIAQLMSVRKGQDRGAPFLNYAQGLNQNQTQERANRANDLQQVTGLYNMVKNRDLTQQLVDMKAGVPHTPDPALAQLEQKMMALSGSGMLTQGSPDTPIKTLPVGQAPQQPPQPPPQLPQGVSSAQLAAGGFPQPPAPQAPAGMPQVPPQAPGLPQIPQQGQQGDPLQNLRDMGDLIAMQSGHPELAAENLYKRSLPAFSRGVGFDQSTGLPLGGMVDNMPTKMVNGRMTIIPNDLTPAMAARTGAVTTAKEAAEFPYKTTQVQTASGAMLPKLLSSVVGTPNLPASAPQGPASLPQIGQPPTPQAPQPGVASLQVTQPSKNSADPWAGIPLRYTPQGLGQTTFDKGMAEKQADAASTISTDLGAKADAANQRIAINNQALDLIGKADTGPMAAQIGDVKNWLVSRFGVPESSFANTPSATAALQKDLMNAATNRAKQQFGSRMTQSEVMLMLSRGAPNVDMTKAAMTYLVNSDNAMSGYAVKQSQDFGTYLQKGGDPQRFYGDYATRFPATGALAPVKLNTATTPAPPAGLTLPAGYKYIGPVAQ